MCPVGVTGKLSKGDPKGIPDICPGRHVYNVVKHLSRGGSVDLSRGINYMFNAVLGVCVWVCVDTVFYLQGVVGLHALSRVDVFKKLFSVGVYDY